MSSAPDILCLGEPLVEYLRQPDGSDRPQGIGGDTSNAGIAAARQGARVGYVTALGRDAGADTVLDFWAAEGIDTSLVRRDTEAPTGAYTIVPDPEARQFIYDRVGSAASWMCPSDLDLAAVARAKVLHVSGITLAVSEDLRATALSAARACRAAGGAVSLDTNLRLALWSAEQARAVLDRTIREVATIVITSEDDSAHLLGTSDPEAILDHYLGLGAETVLVTMGAKGCRMGGEDGRTTIPSWPTEAVDSTGAGDSFAGAYLAWWLELGDPAEAARRAAIVAAGTVSGYGATAPIPRRAEVLAVL